MWMIYSRWWKDKGEAGCSSHHMYDINPIKLQKYRFVYKPAVHRESLDRKCHTSSIVCLLFFGSCLLFLGIALTCTGLLAPGIKNNPTLWIVVGPTCIILGILVLVFVVEIIKNKCAHRRRSDPNHHSRDPEHENVWKGVSNDELQATLEQERKASGSPTRGQEPPNSPPKRTPPTSPPKRIQSPPARHLPTSARTKSAILQQQKESRLQTYDVSADECDSPTPTNMTLQANPFTYARNESPAFVDATPPESPYSPKVHEDLTFSMSVDSSTDVQYEEDRLAVIIKTTN